MWGSRGSVASPGPETMNYGGNTSCVEVRNASGDLLVLDSGTGARRLGRSLLGRTEPVHVVLTHLHLDHIQGLGFFAPLYVPGLEVHLWGPASKCQDHKSRLARYLSPPLFPVWLKDLPCDLHVHDLSSHEPFEVPGFRLRADKVCHPGFTYGVRVEADGTSLTYVPDHEPALLEVSFPARPEWVSGYDLALGTSLLIHDAQYEDEDYPRRVGWGHSATSDLITFTRLVRPRVLMPFHFEPAYDDSVLDRMVDRLTTALGPDIGVVAGREGITVDVEPAAAVAGG